MGRIAGKIVPFKDKPIPKDIKMNDRLVKIMATCRFRKAATVGIEKTTFHAIPWVLEEMKWVFKAAVIFYFLVSYGVVAYYTSRYLNVFFNNRQEKVSFAQETVRSIEYPRITACSPAFFNKTKLINYGLDDEEDDLANYLILSLQVDQVVPKTPASKNQSDFDIMDARLEAAMSTHNVSYLELLRDLAVDCNQFVLFLRERAFGPNWEEWPSFCGDVFSPTPIFTPFGSCFTTQPNFNLSTSSIGVTERFTLLFSTHMTIKKSAKWLQDDALKTGVFFSLTRSEHIANSLFENSRSLSPGTANLVAMKQAKKDRSLYSKEKADIFTKESEYCSDEIDQYEKNYSSVPMKFYNKNHCQRIAILMKFQEMKECRVSPLYGTLDLEENATWPICRRAQMQEMMPILRAMEAGNIPVCPEACIEDDIEMDLSFTILSDESFEETWKLWPVPQNYTKFDAVFMDLYFTSLTSQVTVFTPTQFIELLGNIGGFFGLFLGGSLFSIVESVIIVTVATIGIVRAMFIMCNVLE